MTTIIGNPHTPPLEPGGIYYFFRRPERTIYARYIGAIAPGWLEVHPMSNEQGPTALSLNLTMRIKPEQPFVEDMNQPADVKATEQSKLSFKISEKPWPNLEIGKSYRFDRECEFRRSERGVVVSLDQPAPGWAQIRSPSLVPPYYEINWVNMQQCFQIIPDPDIMKVLKNIRVNDDVIRKFLDKTDFASPQTGEPYLLHMTREASVEGVLLYSPKPGWLVVSPDGVPKNAYMFNLDLCYMIEPSL
jgi:hypothetical protein